MSDCPDYEKRREKGSLLNEEEIDWLESWGIHYPWSPSQAVPLIRRIQKLEERLQELEKNAC